MERHTISLGKDRYLVELVTREDSDEVTVKKFRVLSNYAIVNDMMIVTDLYFIDSDMMKSEDQIIWPASELSNVPLMSIYPKSYNSGYTSIEALESAIEQGTLIDSDMYEKNLSVMKVKIWHPTTALSSDLIFYADSYVNSIHYHWICKKVKDGKNCVGKETWINQDIYNEYFEIEIPDYRDFLFNNTFMKDNSPIKRNEITEGKVRYVEEPQTSTFAIHADTDVQIYDKWSPDPTVGKSEQLTGTSLLLYRWKYYKDEEGVEWKEYVDDKSVVENGISLNFTLMPWTTISNDGTYQMSSNMKIGSCQFTSSMKFSIVPIVGFNEGVVSSIGRVSYPKVFSNTKEAWQNVYHTDFSRYRKLSSKVEEDEEAMEILGGDSHMVKYSCVVSSDKDAQHIIHTEVAYADYVDDFCFPLKDLFISWNQIPSVVWITLYIEDRAIGKNCKSPTKMFTKEWLKYTINEQRYTRVGIKKRQTEIEDMNKENFNFISTLNCRISRDITKDNNGVVSSNNGSPRIIYKPLFYRTQDSQSIKLRSGLEQNIGISLQSYMTKVDEFVVKIGESIFREAARNGTFVIFKINAKEIDETSGKYDILTSESEYITSGNYIIE